MSNLLDSEKFKQGGSLLETGLTSREPIFVAKPTQEILDDTTPATPEQPNLEQIRGVIESFDQESQTSQIGAELSQEAIKAQLTERIRSDVEQFKQELQLGTGLMDRLTSAMPKVRAFWKHKYTGWARLGLGLGLTAGLIASAVTGAWTLAFGAATARMLLGFVSTFMASQELQATMARQRETKSSKDALADKSQSIWRRGWNAAKNFLTDSFDVSTEQLSARKAKASLGQVLVAEASQTKAARDTNIMETEVVDRLASVQAERLSNVRVAARYMRHARVKFNLEHYSDAQMLEFMIGRVAMQSSGVKTLDGEQPNLHLQENIRTGQQEVKQRTRNSFIAAGAVASTIGLIGTDFSRLAETGKWIANVAYDLRTNPINTMARFFNWGEQVTGNLIVGVEEGIKNAPRDLTAVATDLKDRLDHPLIDTAYAGESALTDTDKLAALSEFEGIRYTNYKLWLEKVRGPLKLALEGAANHPTDPSFALPMHWKPEIGVAFKYSDATGQLHDFRGYTFSPKVLAILKQHGLELIEKEPDKLYKLLSLQGIELDKLDVNNLKSIDVAFAAKPALTEVANHPTAPSVQRTVDDKGVVHIKASGDPTPPGNYPKAGTYVGPGDYPRASAHVSVTHGDPTGKGIAAQSVDAKAATKLTAHVTAPKATGAQLSTATPEAPEPFKSAIPGLGEVHKATDINESPEVARAITKKMAESQQFANALGYSKDADHVLRLIVNKATAGEPLHFTHVAKVSDGTTWFEAEVDGHRVKIRLDKAGNVAGGVATLRAGTQEIVNPVGSVTQAIPHHTMPEAGSVKAQSLDILKGNKTVPGTLRVEPVTPAPAPAPTPEDTFKATPTTPQTTDPIHTEPQKPTATPIHVETPVDRPAPLPTPEDKPEPAHAPTQSIQPEQSPQQVTKPTIETPVQNTNPGVIEMPTDDSVQQPKQSYPNLGTPSKDDFDKVIKDPNRIEL